MTINKTTVIKNNQGVRPDMNILVLGIFEFSPNLKCEYCTDPSPDVYSFPDGTHEYPESNCICGKCIIKNQKLNRGEFNSFNLPSPILEF